MIAAFGAGTVAGSMFEAIKEARAKGVPVVITGAPTGTYSSGLRNARICNYD